MSTEIGACGQIERLFGGIEPGISHWFPHLEPMQPPSWGIVYDSAIPVDATLAAVITNRT